MFTALQLQKVPSKLLLFPDEGHWVLKPQNSLLWYKTFIDWIEQLDEKVRNALIILLLVILSVPLALFFLSTNTQMQIARTDSGNRRCRLPCMCTSPIRMAFAS